MKKVLTAAFTFFTIALVTKAQKVTGVVQNEQGKGLEKATVSLLRTKDSSVIKLAVANESGQFSLLAPQPGTYLVQATYVGYTAVFSNHFEVSGSGETTVPALVISKLSGNLQEVSVSTRKPMVEVKADKTILNVEGTINATGNDALELLRKSPGVMVDKDDRITLAGKNGVQIYIDGKPTPMAGTDLSNYLKSIQSAQIESIEIITNPSARYDAAGNAGIINIRLKKNKAFGTNGSLNAGYNIGVYPKYNAGFSLNHRNKSINVFGNYNYNNSKNNNIFHLYRSLLDTIFDQKNTMINENESHGFKAGVDYFVSRKSVLGLLINGNISEMSFNSSSRTPIQYKLTGVVDRLLVANNSNSMNRDNVNFNLNYKYADTAGRELNMDADYGFFRINTNQLQPNYYYDATGTTLQSQFIYRFISPIDINIYTVKADYEQNFKKGKLGAGAKTAIVSTWNNFQRFNVSQLQPEIKQLDVPRSNQFDYNENINALYLNYNRQFPKGVMIQAGVRMENTVTTGDSYGLNSDGTVNKSSKQTFERNYTDFFPSASVTFNKNPMSQWGISYSRRIDRPAYQDLNPFEFKLDEYTFQKGNTSLKPQYSNIFSLTNTYKYKLTTSLSYTHVNDLFTQLVDTTENSKSFITQKNLASQDVVAMNISYPFMYKSYMAFMNLSGNYSKYQADFGGGNRKVDLNAFTLSLYMQHSLKFGKKKDWTGEVSGFYVSPSVWEGTFESKAMWSMDAGLQKTVLKGKGNLKVSVSDVFFTMKWKGESNFAGQQTIASGNWESRQLRTSFTWRFGNSQVKAARERKDASEEEKKRTQSKGGIGNN